MKSKSLLVFTYIFLQFILFVGAQTPAKLADYTRTFYVYSSEGNNAVGLCYNPQKELYYGAFGGNESYPIEVYSTELGAFYSGTINADIRSIWYNSKKNKLGGILFDQKGIFEIDLNEYGIPTKIDLITKKFDQNAQYGAAYNSAKDEIIFVESNEIIIYKGKGNGKKRVTLSTTAPNGLNETCPQWTGVKGYELALLGTSPNQVYLFNYKTGKQTAEITLNGNFADEISMFNVGYANDIIYLYDKLTRSWIGYRIFE